MKAELFAGQGWTNHANVDRNIRLTSLNPFQTKQIKAGSEEKPCLVRRSWTRIQHDQKNTHAVQTKTTPQDLEVMAGKVCSDCHQLQSLSDKPQWWTRVRLDTFTPPLSPRETKSCKRVQKLFVLWASFQQPVADARTEHRRSKVLNTKGRWAGEPSTRRMWGS